MELYLQRMRRPAISSRLRNGVLLTVLAAGLARAEQAPAPAPVQPENPAPAANPAPPSSNPYQAISSRNAFGLLPPPPPPDPDAANQAPPPPPPVTVRLTGVTDLLGKKMAMFVFTEQAAAKANPKPVTLKEGERQDGVEVLSINLANNSVRLSNNGQITNVTFAKMESAAPGPAPGPGGPGGPPGFAPRIPGMSQPNPALRPNGNASAVPPQAANTSTIIGGDSSANGSVIVGGVPEAAPRLGSRGSISSVGSGDAPAAAPVYSTGGVGGGTAAYSTTPGSGIITSSGSSGDTPARPTRTSTPRYKVPMPPDLPIPGGAGGQQ